ncbi:hypothetical protein CKO28_03270 [Rhodovibrio sodomensis]|uniref:Exonuclease domain-containing protein n=1 Tax=Rhodovibrio sodomensis TaxID=1088 RepID=A0ABS1D9L5_9PROT|nr:hypothetical protein [Rhodovibrio sodomensis]MBK1667065.1 hypothetical protein [Rhodovibrio sodomensis]
MPRYAFIDIEASSLSRASYPIEIGFALASGGAAEARLILPHPDWTDWDPGAQEIHGISRAQLFEHGHPGPDVVAWLREHLADCQLVVGAPEDRFWFSRLLKAADSAWQPNLHLAEALLEAQALKRGRNLSDLRQAVRTHHPHRHRAAADAAYLRDLYRAACRR